jgi:predicted nucleotidyltransferase
MTRKLLDLSEKVDKFTVELFEIIANVAGSMNAPFFVVGATARDIILEYGYGRHPERNRDAKDLGFLMRTYIDAGNEERLFEQEADIIEILQESGSYDYVRASARLLGRDISAIAHPETKESLLRILEKETSKGGPYRLVEDMRAAHSLASSDFEENLVLLEELKAGVLEGPQITRKS